MSFDDSKYIASKALVSVLDVLEFVSEDLCMTFEVLANIVYGVTMTYRWLLAV